MIKIIHSAKQATKDFNQKVKDFEEIQGRMERQHLKKSMKQDEENQEQTLDGYLMQKGIPVSFATKAALAQKMGIKYTGEKKQDKEILSGAQGLHENEANEKQAEHGRKMAEKEFELKEKELELKRQTAEANKAPTAEEIADVILKKYKDK